MNIHCVLGSLEQIIYSEATLCSSKKDDKTISTQYSLQNYSASKWKLQLAEKSIEGDLPTQQQNSTIYSPLPDTCLSNLGW